ATFSEAMAPGSLTTTTFSLSPAATATVTYDPATRTATLNPNADLAPATLYTATITTAATDVAGNGLAVARTWSFTTAAAGATETVTFLASDDTHANSTSPTRNYGLLTTFRSLLGTSTTSTYTSFIRFEVAGLAGRTITGATLRLYTTDGSPDGGAVHRTDTSWTETTLTASNAPAPVGGSLASVGTVTTNTWKEIVLPASVVSVDGPVAFVLVPVSTNSAFYSSRQGTNPPQLVLQLSGGSTLRQAAEPTSTAGTTTSSPTTLAAQPTGTLATGAAATATPVPTLATTPTLPPASPTATATPAPATLTPTPSPTPKPGKPKK
ncbi:MAG TPA: DNRLRE domain-containing protein, partial [Candidatus Limnocylindrales bacterium]